MALIKINNKEYGWGDVTVTLFGRPVLGITGIEYKLKQAKETRFGMGRTAKSIQRGKREVEGTITIMQSELIALNTAARANGNKDLLDVDFDIIVSYNGGFMGTVATFDKIICASVTELPVGLKEGDMQAEIALPFLALDVDFDFLGVSLA